MKQAIYQFRNAMLKAGLTPPPTIQADGQKHRFSTNGKANDQAGEYKLHLDKNPAGYFKDYRSGIYQTWKFDDKSIWIV